MKHIVVECGRNTVITVTREWKDEDSAPFILPAYVGETRQINLKNDPLSTEIVLGTTFGNFFLGDLARAESKGGGRLMTKSKIHADTKALILGSVARAAENGDEINLTTNLPIQQHTKSIKKAMQQLLLGTHAVVLDGEKKQFTIKQVNVGAEGAAAYMYLCRGAGGTRRFIDLGSRMMNFATVKNGRFINSESNSLNYGCDTVDGGDLVHRLVSDLSAVWPDFNDWTYLLGGGALEHSEALMRYFPRLLCATYPVVTNALALWSIGEEAIRSAEGVGK